MNSGNVYGCDRRGRTQRNARNNENFSTSVAANGFAFSRIPRQVFAGQPHRQPAAARADEPEQLLLHQLDPAGVAGVPAVLQPPKSAAAPVEEKRLRKITDTYYRQHVRFKYFFFVK